jgi:hypothetical protein
MKSNYILYLFAIIIIIFSLFLSGCKEYSIGEDIFNDKPDFSGSPVITSIEPAGGADAGIRIITLQGENFISSVDSIPIVYFDGTQAVLASVSDTRIDIHRPNIYGDPVTIVLSRDDGYNQDSLKFRIDRAVEPYQEINESTVSFYAFAMDDQENMYISSRDVIYKLPPPSPEDTSESVYAETGFRSLNDMRMGPDGYLYILRGDTNICRIDPVTFATDTFAVFPHDLSKFDFDENHNLYVGSAQGLSVVSSEGHIKVQKQGYEEGFTFQSVRVCSGFVYVAAEYSGSISSYPSAGIWRSEISNASGDLNEEELYFDYANSGDFSDGEIVGITFAENGDMYVAVNGHPTHPIWIIHTDLSYEPLYQDPRFFEYENDNRSANQIMFGSGNYLYLNRGATAPASDLNRITRFGLTVQGAPYYGRE